jgi:hypothetical protein
MGAPGLAFETWDPRNHGRRSWTGAPCSPKRTPGFPVEFPVVDELHAAFLDESRTRIRRWRPVQEIRDHGPKTHSSNAFTPCATILAGHDCGDESAESPPNNSRIRLPLRIPNSNPNTRVSASVIHKPLILKKHQPFRKRSPRSVLPALFPRLLRLEKRLIRPR